MIEDHALIVCDEMAEKEGMIILPENHSERSRIATVIAIGPGTLNGKGELVPPILKVGDRVIIKWHVGDHLHLPGKTMDINGKEEKIDEIRFRIIRCCEAQAVIESD